MNTTDQLIVTGRRRRRIRSAHFKAEGVCQQPDVCIAAVALTGGLNAAMLHRRVRKAERSGKPSAAESRAQRKADSDTDNDSEHGIESDGGFMPLPMPSGPVSDAIRR